ncbi:MAG: cytochrome c3 family protein [Blastocatellia bacterium]
MDAPVAAQGEDNCIACHRRQNAGQVVAIFHTSTHSRVSVGCDGCHGGDSSKTDKSGAHGEGLIIRPDTGATLEMCGKCHPQPLAFFKKSRHVAAQPNAGRLDCVECHGVHGIGAASDSLRWPSFCAGCHGLEYLPPLPRTFQEMLVLSDDLREGIHRLERKGRAPARELINRRREIRHLISEIVHQTDSKGGVERIPRILELGSTLKRQIALEEKR